MGARWLKAEEKEIVDHYPIASPAEMCRRIPDRTWSQIGVHARRMGIHRTTQARGNSIREGRKKLKGTWSDQENDRFDRYYPNSTRVGLIDHFYPRTWLALQSHAEKRGIHRTREAIGREIKIGREEEKKRKIVEKVEKSLWRYDECIEKKKHIALSVGNH